MAADSSFRQTGFVGPWRPAFLLSGAMLLLTISVIYWNEHKAEAKFCQAPGFGTQTYPLVLLTLGATLGHFVVQLAGAFSKYESNKHSSASLMILLITGIQAASQTAMVADVVKLSCQDYFGVRTSVFLWVEWMATVPIMFYLTTIMDVNKFQLTKEDKTVIFAATFGLFCLYLLNFGTVSPPVAIFLMIIANLFMTAALFWLHGSSYFAHRAAVKKAKNYPDAGGPLTNLFIEVKHRKLLCAGFMNYFFTLFPVAYFLKCADIIDHDTFYVSFCLLNFLCKGIFAALVTDSHSELLDPKTFLLYSERERMETARRAFMRYVFHEIHVPLKSVTLGLKLLEESNQVQGSDMGTVRMVKDASDLITETLNDILAVHKIEEGKLVLDMSPLHLYDLLHQAKSNFKLQMEAKNITATYQIARSAPQIVLGDRVRLDHVLGRLISNAIQNVEGESDAKISVSISYSTMIEGYVTFSVTDSGVEMTEAVKKNLFKPVAQISPDDLMQGNDSGLGLAICMDIVSLHGGTIGCESPLKVTSVGEESSGGNELFFNIKFEVSVEEDDDDSN